MSDWLNVLLTALLSIALVCSVGLIILIPPFLLMTFWNLVIPDLLGLKEINLIESYCIIAVLGIVGYALKSR